MALLKKQKEEKLKAPGKPIPVADEPSRPKKPAPAARQQTRQEGGAEGEEGAPPPQRQNKWYMGQYGQTEGEVTLTSHTL